MSFDTEFDFTAALSKLSSDIVELQNEITNIDAQIALYDNAPDYTSVTQEKRNELLSLKDQHNNNIQKTQDVINEINALLAETQENKDTLYYFYTVVEDFKNEYMSKMLFNYQTALADPTIQQLLLDTTTVSESKTAVAKIIYSDYRLNEEYSRIIISIYRYF